MSRLFEYSARVIEGNNPKSDLILFVPDYRLRYVNISRFDKSFTLTTAGTY